MKRLIVNLVVIFFLSSLLSQCKKEKSPEEKSGEKIGEIKLTNAELDIIPYQLNDTLTFKDSLGNSQLFIVTSRSTNLNRYHKDGGTDSKTDFYDIEKLTVSIKNNNDVFFNLDLTAPLPTYVSNSNINKNYFRIYSNSFGNEYHYAFSNYIDATDFYYTLEGVSIPFFSNYTIFNNTYNSVYELSKSASPRAIFYNTSLGIVGYKTNNNETWYLDN